MVFRTKLVSDPLYKKNGQKVEIIRAVDEIFLEIKFEDGTVATVYKSEIGQ